MRPAVDHLVYGCVDLDAGCSEIEHLLGVRPVSGGSHPGWGTHNALLSLGRGVYLEVISPDPGQPDPQAPRPFGLDFLREARIVTWAARVEDIGASCEVARGRGYDPGRPRAGSRALPDGGRLEWKLTPPGDGIVPFLVEWGLAHHPSLSAPRGCALIDLEAEHPHPESVTPSLDALGADLQVSEGGRLALLATIECPVGTVVLS